MRIKKGWPALHDSFEKHHEMAGFFFNILLHKVQE